MNLAFTQEYPWGGATNFQAKVLSFYGKEPYNELFLPKKHSFRSDPTERWEEGKKIHFHHGGRKLKYNCWHIGECTGVQNIKIQYRNVPVRGFILPHIWVDNKLLDYQKMELLAANDGFDNLTDFFRWFNKDFTGRIIHWSDVRY